MKKSSSTWVILSLCGFLILGGMGWLSSRVISMEEDRSRAATEAHLQGRIRLGLSRMDTAASGLLLIENQRPPYHYRAFYQPEDVFDTDFENLGKGSVVRPSPLASELPEFVNLHFEITPDGQVHSPQVPGVDDQVWGKIIAPSVQVLESATSNLQRLQIILSAPPQQSVGQIFQSNMEMLCSPELQQQQKEEAESKDIGMEQQQRSQWLVAQRADNGNEAVINSPGYQAELTRSVKGNRAARYNDSVKKAVKESGNTLGYYSEQGRRRAKTKDDKLQSSLSEFDLAQAGADPPSASQPAPPQEVEADADDSPIGTINSVITPFQALWVAGELFAVRSVETDGVKRFQGVWFEANALREYLVGTVRSDQLLPKATLVAIGMGDKIPPMSRISSIAPTPINDDPLGLVTMPWRLVPGETIIAQALGWSELRLSLGIGWVAALFGLLAAAVLMRGVMRLSERRASFVSSVTHELRTPLTTFQLYSDMLAEGMVTDEAKKTSYLKTLRREAGRLNHLIENVLAYSRIERGTSKTRSEALPLVDLIQRLQPRLEQRVQEVNAALAIEIDPASADTLVQTDVGAVEQIVFNLIDNSCKYGLPEEDQGALTLRANATGKRLQIEVCDNGRGIARRDRAQLFRPFQKSSCDEADTKPGVGLGLSLCRRLARALGGNLIHSPQKGGGACFLLKLPKKH